MSFLLHVGTKHINPAWTWLGFFVRWFWKWVTQSRLTLYNPMDYTVCAILQARILEWVAFSFSRGIFPTQGLNPGLLHYQLSHKGCPRWFYLHTKVQASSCSLISNLTPSIFFHTNPVHLLAAKYTRNLTISHHSHCFYSGPSHHHHHLDKCNELWTRFFAFSFVPLEVSSNKMAGESLTEWSPNIYVYVCIYLAMLCIMWDLSSPTRDGTWALCSESMES